VVEEELVQLQPLVVELVVEVLEDLEKQNLLLLLIQLALYVDTELQLTE
jgi:hypothetical protein